MVFINICERKFRESVKQLCEELAYYIFLILGHDYYGRSSAPNSLLIWTHNMRDMEFTDDFTPVGGYKAFSAVTLSAGLTWLDVYAAASVDRNLVS